jgi:hypothetical protein
MSDYLQNPYLKQVLSTLNIPVPSPELLVRNESAIQYDELLDKTGSRRYYRRKRRMVQSFEYYLSSTS